MAKSSQEWATAAKAAGIIGTPSRAPKAMLGDAGPNGMADQRCLMSIQEQPSTSFPSQALLFWPVGLQTHIPDSTEWCNAPKKIGQKWSRNVVDFLVYLLKALQRNGCFFEVSGTSEVYLSNWKDLPSPRR
eukprot:EG_transcript_43766